MAALGRRAGRPRAELNGEKFPAPARRFVRFRPAGTFQLTEVNTLSVFTLFMKVVSSIKSAKKRHPACQVVRRKGRIYVINKVEPRYKARQG